MSAKYYHPDTDFLRKLGAPPPTTATHLTEEEIAQRMQELKPNTWHMEGNKLIGETDMGRLVQYLPTDYICTGTDENGKPLLTKVQLQ